MSISSGLCTLLCQWEPLHADLKYPRNEGDVEVDVNDIAHSLEKVILTRQAEDTWQLDSFSGDSVVSNRPPDEV
jgi:hypothetical protein